MSTLAQYLIQNPEVLELFLVGVGVLGAGGSLAGSLFFLRYRDWLKVLEVLVEAIERYATHEAILPNAELKRTIQACSQHQGTEALLKTLVKSIASSQNRAGTPER